jgi:hypothetical protein
LTCIAADWCSGEDWGKAGRQMTLIANEVSRKVTRPLAYDVWREIILTARRIDDVSQW